MTSVFNGSGDLLIYLRMLSGETGHGQFFDIRWAAPGHKMRRRFIPALRIHEAAALIRNLVSRADVYVGVALRHSNTHGGKRAISGSHLLYIECDDPEARERVHRFSRPPSMIVASGSPGHLHIYWCLRERAVSSEVESANRRLALALHGDPASVDIARVLRPPTSLNHKHHTPGAVTLLQYNSDARYGIGELTRSLPKDPRPAAGTSLARPRLGRTELDKKLLAIPASEYVRVLAGVEPNRAGKVLCPFHPESNPSLHLYPDGTFHCFGKGCRKGGTIFDFAAARWGMGTRKRDFLALRKRLAVTFHLNQEVRS
jgi:hypothetical protein